MSLLDTASLIVTPNGYKEGKLFSVIPSDGSGDMLVTRATTATRKNSAGLVELVPYNLFEYSQDLTNAAYTSGGTGSVVVTANYGTAPDGTTTADRLQITRGATYQEFFQRITGYSGQQVTMSFYAKSLSGTPTLITAFNDGYYNEVTFTTEWVRYEYTFTAGTNVTGSGFNLLTFVSFPSTSASADLLVWGVQLVQGSTAKDYQKTETRLNIPRLDYSNGTCPSLLVEPQRTNEAPYSSSFDNAAWTKYQASITANNTTDPSGVLSADKFLDSTANDIHATYAAFLISSATTISAYVKSAEYTRVAISNLSDGGDVIFNLADGTIVSTPGNFVNSQIESLDNGWYRISATTNGTSGYKAIGYSLVNNSNQTSFAGTGTSGLFIWGAQIEVGSYSTSYIPTTSASVTRNADVISKTSATALIGQTEGTIFGEFEVIPQKQDSMLCLMRDLAGGLYDDFFYIRASSGVPAVSVRQGATTYVAINGTTALSEGFHKFAFAYKQNDFAFYVDGVQIGTDNSGNVPTCNEIYLGNYLDGFDREVSKKSFALWKTRLTNTQLAQLTSI
jgi:hypothetical protein